MCENLRHLPRRAYFNTVSGNGENIRDTELKADVSLYLSGLPCREFGQEIEFHYYLCYIIRVQVMLGDNAVEMGKGVLHSTTTGEGLIKYPLREIPDLTQSFCNILRLPSIAAKGPPEAIVTVQNLGISSVTHVRREDCEHLCL